MNTLPALLAVTITVLSNSVLAQASSTIYRCGPEGRELSQKPCAEGQVLTPKAITPSAEQRRQAEEVAEREARLGQQMAAERRQREAAEARQATGAAGIHGRGEPAAEAADQAASKPVGKKHGKKSHAPAKPDGFTVVSPKPAKKSKAHASPDPAQKP